MSQLKPTYNCSILYFCIKQDVSWYGDICPSYFLHFFLQWLYIELKFVCSFSMVTCIPPVLGHSLWSVNKMY